MAVIRKTRTKKYELDFYSDGKRQRVTFASRREAEEAKRQVMLGLTVQSSGGQIKPTTLKEAIRFYDATISHGKAAHENEKKYFERLYKALKSHGLTMVHEVGSDHLELFKTERLSKFKASTVNREFNTYRHFFSKCLAWKYCTKNPCSEVAPVKSKRNPRRVWTDEEFGKMISQVPPWAADVLRAMDWLGAGPAELGRLTWADVDFEARRVLLKRYKGDGSEFRRHMPMPDDLFKFFKVKLDRAKIDGRARPANFVFMNSRFKPLDARQLSVLVRRAAGELDLDAGVTPYGLRHKFATELLEAGVGEDTVRKLMGHQDVRTLIDNYSHIRAGAMKEAMEVRAAQTTIGRQKASDQERPEKPASVARNATKRKTEKQRAT